MDESPAGKGVRSPEAVGPFAAMKLETLVQNTLQNSPEKELENVFDP